jgi:hypothetical protein
MFSKSKLLLLAALTVIAVTAFASTSTAASFRIEPQGNIESTSEGKLTFGEGSTTVQCEVTLNGTVSSALLAKVVGTQFGSITQVLINEAGCSGGSIEPAGVLNLPWRLTYQSITGTLPSAVTAILFFVERAQFNLEIFGGFANCLYEGNSGASMAVTGTNPYTSGRITALTSTTLRLIRGGFGCPTRGSMTGRFNTTALRITRL